MIYKNGKTVPVHGDAKPLAIYCDNQYVANAAKKGGAGTSIPVFSEYRTQAVKTAEGLTRKVVDEQYKAGDVAGYSEVVKSQNLLDLSNEKTQTIRRGITYTKNSDGSYTLNGTSDANDSYIDIKASTTGVEFKPGKYRYTLVNNTNSGVSLYVFKRVNGEWANVIGLITTSGVFTIDDTWEGYIIRICVFKSGTTLDNVKIYPMLTEYTESVPTSFQPYFAPFIKNGGVKNLCELGEINETRNGVTITGNNGRYTLNGTSTDPLYYREKTKTFSLKGGKTYLFKATTSGSQTGGKSGYTSFQALDVLNNIKLFDMYWWENRAIITTSSIFVEKDAEVTIAFQGDNQRIFTNLVVDFLVIDVTGLDNFVRPSTYVPADQLFHIFTDDQDIAIADSLKAGDVMTTDAGVRRKKKQIDMGSLSWGMQNHADGTKYFVTNITDAQRPATSSDVPNITSTRYEPRNWSSIDAGAYKDKSIHLIYASSGSYQLRVYDFDFSDASSFKTGVTGLILEYELATPTFEPLKVRPAALTFAKDGYKSLTLSDVRDAQDAHLEKVEKIENKSVNLFNPNTEKEIAAYSAIRVLDNAETMRISIFDKDISVDISGCYLSVSDGSIYVGHGDKFTPFVSNGTIKKTTEVFHDRTHVAVYPPKAETWAKILSRFDIIATKGSDTLDHFVPYANSTTRLEKDGGNLWDEEWELGYYSPSTGNFLTRSNGICSSRNNAVSVKPNTQYYSFGNGSLMVVLFYKENGEYIGNVQVTNSTFTTPAECKKVKFYMAVAYGTTYKNDIAIFEGSEAKPYIPHGAKVSIGLNSVGDVKDGIKFGKSENLFKIIDGTQTKNGSTAVFKGGVVTVTGTATNYYNDVYLFGSDTDAGQYLYLPKGDYSIELFASNKPEKFGLFFREKTHGVFFSIKDAVEALKNYDCYFFGIFTRGDTTGQSFVTYNNFTMKPMIVKGSTVPSEFVPYAEKAVRRVAFGEVDMGDLLWLYVDTSGHEYFYLQKTIGAKLTENTNAKPNMVCDLFTIGSQNDAFYHRSDFLLGGLNWGNGVIVYCSKFTNAADFKNFVKGHKLVFELAEPYNEATELDPPTSCPNVSTTLTADGGRMEAEWYEAR